MMHPAPKAPDLRGVRDLADLVRRIVQPIRDIAEFLELIPRLHVRELEVKSTPITVGIQGLTRPPAGVILMGASLVSDPAATVTAYGLHWVWDSSGAVKITSISGLTAGTAYRVSILVVEA